jgi:hypothetical protein
MSYAVIVASVALSFISFPGATPPRSDHTSSVSGLMRLAQERVPTCKGVKRSGVTVSICCVRESAAGCVTSITECKSRGGSPNSDGAKVVSCPPRLAGHRHCAEAVRV